MTLTHHIVVLDGADIGNECNTERIMKGIPFYRQFTYSQILILDEGGKKKAQKYSRKYLNFM